MKVELRLRYQTQSQRMGQHNRLKLNLDHNILVFPEKGALNQSNRLIIQFRAEENLKKDNLSKRNALNQLSMSSPHKELRIGGNSSA